MTVEKLNEFVNQLDVKLNIARAKENHKKTLSLLEIKESTCTPEEIEAYKARMEVIRICCEIDNAKKEIVITLCEELYKDLSYCVGDIFDIKFENMYRLLWLYIDCERRHDALLVLARIIGSMEIHYENMGWEAAVQGISGMYAINLKELLYGVARNAEERIYNVELLKFLNNYFQRKFDDIWPELGISEEVYRIAGQTYQELFMEEKAIENYKLAKSFAETDLLKHEDEKKRKDLEKIINNIKILEEKLASNI